MAFNKLTVFLTEKENKVINFNNQKVNNPIDAPVFTGVIPIGGDKVKVASTFSDKNVDDIAAELIVKEDCDIAVIVNTQTNSVSFRKKHKCKIDLNKLAAKLCNGKGNSKSAQGDITESFLNFTKLLSEK